MDKNYVPDRIKDVLMDGAKLWKVCEFLRLSLLRLEFSEGFHTPGETLRK